MDVRMDVRMDVQMDVQLIWHRNSRTSIAMYGRADGRAGWLWRRDVRMDVRMDVCMDVQLN